MEVEETFNIAIPDEEASRIVTVDDLYQSVLDHVQSQRSEFCVSRAVFYRLRRAIIARFGVERGQIRPQHDVEELIPWRKRRRAWQQLGQELALELPELERPAKVKLTLALMCLRLAIGIVAACISVFGFNAHAAVSVFIGCVVFIALAEYRITIPLARCIPERCRSVRGLVQTIVLMNHKKVLVARIGANQPEVWNILRALIACQLGVRLEDVTPEARFVADLGVD
jgi:acyl carrier protein